MANLDDGLKVLDSKEQTADSLEQTASLSRHHGRCWIKLGPKGRVPC